MHLRVTPQELGEPGQRLAARRGPLAGLVRLGLLGERSQSPEARETWLLLAVLLRSLGGKAGLRALAES